MTITVREGVPLAPLTTFGIGGTAEYFCEVSTEDELREAIRWAKTGQHSIHILAGGSNVLVDDGGVKGLVIYMRMRSAAFDGVVLTADAGCALLDLIRTAATRDLGGWEKLAGIPGTFGGAIRGNAGAFGTEICDVTESVRTLHIESGDIRIFSSHECEFAYRHSFFKVHPEYIILSGVIRLSGVAREEAEQAIENTIAERERRHLQNVRAAGSFFMNPVAPQDVVSQFETEKGVVARGGRVPAGWLIEKVGLKGATEGDAIASLQHPNYIVNTGSARSSDVLHLALRIREAVKAQYRVELQPEAEHLY